LSIGVVFDCSGSMGKKLEKSREAVAQFFSCPIPRTNFYLVQFNDSANLVQAFTRNLEEIQNKLAFTQSKGRTALLDAVVPGGPRDEEGEEPAQGAALDLRWRRQLQPIQPNQKLRTW